MNTKSWVALVFFFSFLCQIADIQAQSIKTSVQIQWKENILSPIDEENNIELLYFEGAINGGDFPFLPQFYQKIDVDNLFSDYQVEVSNVQTQNLNEHDHSLIPDKFEQTNLEVQVRIERFKKQPFLYILFLPFLKISDNQYAKVLSCDISLIPKGLPLSTQPKSLKNYKSHSIFQKGSWYKVAVNETGLYKVSYEDLQNMGADISNLLSSRIAVFGNGGGMLPEANKDFRYDDLQENPVWISDGGDGRFDAGDYFVFYATSPHSWTYNKDADKFNHIINAYDNHNYYYINVDAGIGEKKRIAQLPSSSLSSTVTITTYRKYAFYEKDETNLMGSGRNWLGELFGYTTEKDFSFDFQDVINSKQAQLTLSAAFIGRASERFTISVNQQNIGEMSGVGDLSTATEKTQTFPFSAIATSLNNIKLQYSANSHLSSAYLNYIELEADCRLRMNASQVLFCQPAAVGQGQVVQFQIANANADLRVWDVSNPLQPIQIQGSLNGDIYSFRVTMDSLRFFVAFNGSWYNAVTLLGRVENQDLHADTEIDMLIVTHPDFITQAQRLAQFRSEHDGLKVKVITTLQVYNEFASGKQDPTAIRDYVKMIYDRTDAVYPRFLLLFGRPSYDYKGIKGEVSNYVPNYQRDKSYNDNTQQVTDDYFGLLDDNEGVDSRGKVDIAIGRFPCNSLSQATIMTDKTIRYSMKTELVNQNQSGVISNLADWRNVMTFVADDEDANLHFHDAEQDAALIAAKNPTINIEKIYLDAYHQVSNAGGSRYPEVNQAIENRMSRGALMVSYIGHGGGDGWAHERILSLSEINSWRNKYNLPIMVTLTCKFARYDAAVISPGELCFVNPEGGVAGLLTTNRDAISSANGNYAAILYNQLFEHPNGKYPTLGELNMLAKQSGVSDITYFLSIIYCLGDPALPLAIPRYFISTDSINGMAAAHFTDTLKALSKVTIKGRVTDENAQTLNDFSGHIYPSIYDKATVVSTLGTDNGVGGSYPEDFTVQKNILFKGNASVKNGHFEFSFFVPKDINYTIGNGKISYYAKMQNQDAAGYESRFLLGGISNENYADSTGPEIRLYMNDESFVNGGITNSNPTLLVLLSDEYGINTTGNGIGHDLLAILDDQQEAPFILNDYYEAKQDTFNQGVVRYPLKNLAVGNHRIKVRAWDVFNNPAESVLDFRVVSDEDLQLDHVLNYPNPFTTHTDFYFEHNQSGESFDILIQIYTISGKVVKTIRDFQTLTGNRSRPVSWNGKDDFDDKLGKGVYFYRLKIRNSQGNTAEKIEKLLLLQ
jgi:hypothetical protein